MAKKQRAPGAIYVDVTVVCGVAGCDVENSITYAPGVQPKMMVAKATFRSEGWKYHRPEGWLCPTHAVGVADTEEPG